MKQIFWKTKTFFKKLEYRFFVESTKIEKVSFPFKTVISEANVKTSKMMTTKWTYYKEQSFASNYFFFLKILCLFKNLKRWFVVPTTQNPNAHICTFCQRWSFILRWFFPVSILKDFIILFMSLGLAFGKSKFPIFLKVSFILTTLGWLLSLWPSRNI